MTQTFIFNGTREELMERLRSLGKVLIEGDSSERQGHRLANAFLDRCQQSFIQKTVPGREGDDGIVWKEHRPYTTNKRQATRSPAAIARFWSNYAGSMSLAHLGGELDILFEKGDLLNSFNPGQGEQLSGVPGQKVEVSSGEVKVRIVPVDPLKKTFYHHFGFHNVRHDVDVPPRPFWPPDGSLPDSYWQALKESYKAGLPDVLARLLT